MMHTAMPRVGDSVAAVDTPALVIDLDAMERNISTMAAFAARHRVALRPHAKLHKCADIAKMQIAAGAAGVCVQKLSEAEALVGAGLTDIYISNEIVDSGKLARFADLAQRASLSIAVDSDLGIHRLAQALKRVGSEATVFVEIDVGQGRCGVPAASAGRLAHLVISGGLKFGGLQAYHGRAQHLRGAQERRLAIGHAVGLIRAAQASITSSGMVCPIVTGGGTGCVAIEAATGIYDELQVGSYLFMDRDYAANEESPEGLRFEHALFVKSQVMSRGQAHAVIDAGHKSHAIDSGPPLAWRRDLEFVNGGDEHGILLNLPHGQADALPQLGDTVWLVPGHCDPTVNLHDFYVAVRGGIQHGVVESVWPVHSRGCVS